MKVGTSLALIAAGLILRYAIDFEVPGVDVSALGAILFYVGLLGLVVTLGLELVQSRAHRPRVPRPPREPRPPARGTPEPYDPVVRPRDRSADPTTVLADPADERTRRLPRR